MAVRITTAWQEKGRVEGRAEGLVEGRAEGQRTAICRYLETRFGLVGEEVRAAVDGLMDPEVLDRVLTDVYRAEAAEEALARVREADRGGRTGT